MMPMRHLLLSLLVLLTELFAARATAQDTVAEEAFTTPTRILSCAPNLTYTLFALGAGERLIGVTEFCDYPPAAKKVRSFGNLYTPNLEAIVAARPDLIVALPSNRPVLEALEGKLGIRLLQTNASDTLADIDAMILELGKAVGNAERAKELVEEGQQGFAALRKETGKLPRRKVLFVVGRDKGSLRGLYAAGQGTYLDELVQAAGGENVVPAEMGRYVQLNREALLLLKPDVIIEHHRGEDELPLISREMCGAWETVPMLPAVREDRLMIAQCEWTMLPGPRMDVAAAELAGLIHLEVFGRQEP